MALLAVTRPSVIEQGAYGLLNGRVSLFVPSFKVELGLWGRNITYRFGSDAS